MRRASALVAAGLASCALFDMGRNGRPTPAWKVNGAARLAGDCATVEPWVVRSGREGMGLGFEIAGRRACALTVAAVEVAVGAARVERPVTLAPARLADGAAVRFYVPVPFDGRATWNAGERAATLTVRGEADGRPFEIAWTMDHEAAR